ncbi:MAG: ATP-binding protein [Candidatus Omnitrophota bacterium]
MKKLGKTEYFISKKVGAAINRFKMIGEGDKVLVGVSGGKDSLTLIRILQERKRWLPIDYTVKAAHIITDYDKHPERKKKELARIFESLGCDYVFKEIAIARKNKLGRQDCFWCSWNRRKALFETAAEIGFTKVALGHHKDDVVETILMNMFYNGELSSINPVQSLFNGKIIIVRPLILLEEKDTSRYASDTGLPVVKSRCPRNDDSKRALVKSLIRELSRKNPDIKDNILRAPHNIKKEYLTDIINGIGLSGYQEEGYQDDRISE